MNPFPILNWSIEAISLAFGLVVILAVLAYATHLISLVLNSVKQFFGRSLKELKAKEALLLKQKEWFANHANIILKSGMKARTVTMNRFIIDAIDVMRPENIASRIEQEQKYKLRSKSNGVSNIQSDDINEDCNLDDFNLASLMSNERAYENYSEELGVGLGGLCICGSGYCDWEEEVFTQFIVDISIWNLKSVTVYKDGVLISTNLGVLVDTSSFSGGSHVSPNGTYLLVEMDLTGGLSALMPGDMVKVVFRWCDADGTERCAILYNEIPGASENVISKVGTVQALQNGAVPSLNEKS